MKFSIQKSIAAVAIMTMLSSTAVSVNAGAAYEETAFDTSAVLVEGAGTGGSISPNSLDVHYDYDIPDFYLESGETVYTTRYGYGFDVSTEGLNHNDFDITFYVDSTAANLTVSVMTLENYTNNVNSYVASKTITGSGSKTINFNNLDYGTYVIVWHNNGSAQINISSANLSTSY